MEKVAGRTFKHFVVTLPWALVRFLGRIVKRFFIALGVLVALVVLGYVGFEFIVETIDSRYSGEIDAHLGIDKNAISRLHDPAYFAEESVIVSEDQKTVACISSPEHRILLTIPLRSHRSLSRRFSPRRQELTRTRASTRVRFCAREGDPSGESLRRIDADDADRQTSSLAAPAVVDGEKKNRRHQHGAEDRSEFSGNSASRTSICRIGRGQYGIEAANRVLRPATTFTSSAWP
jgi:hypothetical protein